MSCTYWLQLGKLNEALEFAEVAGNLASSTCEAEMVATIKGHLVAAEAEKVKKDNEDTPRSETRHGRLRSLSDVLFRAELNSPHSESRYEREDSDYEEEMELDFETSISGDEGRDTESSILRGSLNLRFHRKDDSARESSSIDGAEGSPSSSSQNYYHTLQMWTPHAQVPSMVAGGIAGPETADVWGAIEINQRKLCRLLNFWSVLGCMNLLKEPYILLSVPRANLFLSGIGAALLFPVMECPNFHLISRLQRQDVLKKKRAGDSFHLNFVKDEPESFIHRSGP
ncbi:hypothetical protein GW17_00027967, partial [Ensete ventricosum]